MKNRHRMLKIAAKVLIVAIVIIGIILSQTGCTTQLPWRDADCPEWAEVNEKTVKGCEARILKKEEREYARNLEVERIEAFILSCQQSSMMLVYDGWNSVGSHIRQRRLDTYIPKHAHLSDYHCISRAQFQALMRSAGYG